MRLLARLPFNSRQVQWALGLHEGRPRKLGAACGRWRGGMVSPKAGQRGAGRLDGAMRRAPRATSHEVLASSPFLLGPSSILILRIFPPGLEYF